MAVVCLPLTASIFSHKEGAVVADGDGWADSEGGGADTL